MTSLSRRIVLSGLVASGVVLAGCTVRPLYSSEPLTPGSTVSPSAELATIAVKPVDTRYAQQVRNNLIFALSGGAGEPADPVYSLSLIVSRQVTAAALIQNRTDEDEPTAGTVTLSATFILRDNRTGKVVTSGRRSMPSSFDRPRQQFAVIRAQQDAENRAARELAELVRLAIIQGLVKPQAAT